jgi:hypothetical protein
MQDLKLIKDKYNSGELEEIKGQLVHFLRQNRDAFWKFREREMKIWQKDINPFICLKLFILEKKTIDFKSEMLSQIDAIRREVESRGQGLSPTEVNRIKEEWTRNNAASWRAHRILEIIYILNQNREMFLQVLSEGREEGSAS